MFDQLSSEPVYNCAFKVSLQGNLNWNVLSTAITSTVRKQIAFRTTFHEINGEVMQSVSNDSSVPLEVVDFRSLKNSERKVEIEALNRELIDHRFDLSTGPLVTIKLVELPKREAILLFCVHHIIFDGWSFKVFMDDLTESYRLAAEKKLVTSDASSINYIDYCATEASRVEDSLQRDFWTKELEGFQKVSLPTDYPRKKLATYAGDTLTSTFSKELYERVAKEAERLDSTMFAYMLAVYKVMVYKYTQATDIIVGGPLANRMYEETQSMVGYFSNMLPYRTNFDDTQSFESLVHMVTDTTRKVYDKQNTPVNLMYDCLPKSCPGSSLFDTTFVLQNSLELAGTLNRGLYWQANIEAGSYARFDLAFAIFLHENNDMEFRFEYNTDLFNEETIERMKDNYVMLLESCLSNPSECVGHQVMLSSNQKHQLTKFTMENEKPLGINSLYQMVEQIANVEPEQVAIKCDAQEISFAELVNQAKRIAAKLRKENIRGGDRVVLSDVNGVECVQVMLAAMRLGAVVCFAPEGCEDSFRSDSVGNSVIVCENKDRGIQVSMLTRADCTIEDEQSEPCAFSDDDVVCEIANDGEVTKFTHSQLAVPGELTKQYQEGRVFASLAKPGTMGFLFEVESALRCGNTLCFPSAHEVEHAEDLHFFIQANNITSAVLAPRIAARALDTVPEVFENIECLFLPYEESEASSVLEMYSTYQLCMPESVCTVYTSSKHGSWLLSHELGEDDLESAQIPLGTPISGNSCFVLDAFKEYSPIGIAGTLYGKGAAIHGESLVGLGTHCLWSETGILYLHWSQQASFGSVSQSDLALMTSSLRRHDLVNDGVVVNIKLEDGGKDYNIAYYSTYSGEASSESELRQFMINSLPANLVPSIFVHVGAFPLRTNGAIDTVALPKPAPAAISTPTSSLEMALIELWATVLELPSSSIDITASFFEIGGHSIALAKMLSKVKKTFGVHIALPAFIKSPFISFLVKAIGSDGEDIEGVSVDTEQMRNDAILPCGMAPIAGKPANVESPENVLLTGATGFLGIFLLEKLLNDTTAKIYCHVRASDIAAAWQKLYKTASDYMLGDIHPQNERIEVVLGDLSAPQIGLSGEVYEHLCSVVDVIYHCGALVHHVYGYKHLREANVFSTRDILEIACTSKNKAVFYISSAAAVSEVDPFTGLLVEKLTESVPMSAGYSQSKWVSEHLVDNAAKAGIHAMTFRPGNITGHSQSGLSNAFNNHTNMLLKGCIQMGAFPDWKYDEIEMTPVDTLASAIVDLSRLPSIKGTILNMANPHRVYFKDYVKMLCNTADHFEPNFVGDKEWRAKHVSQVKEDNALFSLSMMYSSDEDAEPQDSDDSLEDGSPQAFAVLDTDKAQSIMKCNGIDYPTDYKSLLAVYISKYFETGFWNEDMFPSKSEPARLPRIQFAENMVHIREH